MGLFDASSHSSTSDSRQGAADQGKNFRGNNRYTESGSLQLDRGSDLNTGFSFKGNNVRGDVKFISSTDPEIVNAALGTVADTTQSFTDTLASLIGIQQLSNDNETSLLSNALGKLSSLDLNAQTGGDSSRNDIVLYVMLGLLVVVGIFFWRR
jgi:hypothetical protein